MSHGIVKNQILLVVKKIIKNNKTFIYFNKNIMSYTDLDSVNLEDLQKGEKLLSLTRRHWIVHVISFVYIFFLVISVIILLVYKSLLPSFISNGFFYPFVIIYVLWFILFIYINWVNNELDLILVTNKRVIWIDQISFLNRSVSECSLNDVQEVNIETKWLLANLFNFWKLSIHTASEESKFHMWVVPNVIDSARNIQNIVHSYKATAQEYFKSELKDSKEKKLEKEELNKNNKK